LIQGGLTGSYYTNRWFSGEVYQTRLDSEINFNWGKGDILENVASNYVSIEWNGFIKPLHSEEFTFEAHFNDGLRLWVNDQLLIDSLVDVEDDLLGNTIRSSPI